MCLLDICMPVSAAVSLTVGHVFGSRCSIICPPSGFRPAAEEYTCSGEEAIRVLQTSLECLRASSL